jgi:2-pyrone-4,6-dicarboxylate lactonase
LSSARPSFHPAPSRPGLRLPAGACDTHVHVFGPVADFPYAADAPFRPHEAPKEKLFAMHATLGVERCVIVQSTCHGFDNRVVADAMRARSGAYLGVALVPASAEAGMLKELAAQGFRGVRFNFMRHLGGGVKIADVIGLTRRLEPLGMHLQVHFESSLIHDLAPWFRKSAVPVVVDHMARIDAGLGLDQPDFRALIELMRDERFLVKVSGSERCSTLGPPYADALPFARMLVAEFGDRTLWGTDWPHPNLNHVPDDGQLADLLAQIAPTPEQRQALLVDNPQRFYRFGPTRP